MKGHGLYFNQLSWNFTNGFQPNLIRISIIHKKYAELSLKFKRWSSYHGIIQSIDYNTRKLYLFKKPSTKFEWDCSYQPISTVANINLTKIKNL